MIPDSAASGLRANTLLRHNSARRDIEEYDIHTASLLLFDQAVHDKYEAQTASGLKTVRANGCGDIRVIDMSGQVPVSTVQKPCGIKEGAQVRHVAYIPKPTFFINDLLRSDPSVA